MSNTAQTQAAPAAVSNKVTPKQFMLNVLNGMAIGIVAALVGNAIVGGPISWLVSTYHIEWLAAVGLVATTIQFATAPLIGFLVGTNFKFGPLQCACLSLVAYISAGNVHFIDGAFVTKGLGDVLNVLIMTAIGAFIILKLGNKLGSITIIGIPVIIGIGVSYLGVLTLPYVSAITTGLGNLIEYFTELQPFIMAPLIAITFAFAVASPISSVGLAFITHVSGLAGASANVGVAIAATYLIIAAWRANRIGVPIAIFFGAIKMMLPNLMRRPVLYLPMFFLAAVTGLVLPLTDVVVGFKAAGFGYITLIGPIDALSQMSASLSTATKLTQIGLIYFVVPFGVGIVMHIVLKKIGFYSDEDFKFGA